MIMGEQKTQNQTQFLSNTQNCNTDLAAGGALQFEEGELPKQPTFQRQKPKRGDPDPNPNNHVIVTLAGLRVLLEGWWC